MSSTEKSIYNEVDKLRLSIIRKRENQISILEQKRDSINENIEIEKEYLAAYKKTIPTVEILS